MNSSESNSQVARVLQNGDISLRGVLLLLGSFLILFGLTQPWPCLPGSWIADECSPALRSFVFHELQIILYLALFVILMFLNARFDRFPLNYAVWGCFWLIYFYMIYVRWVPYDANGAWPNTYFTAFSINNGLPGITPTVLPLGLAAFWIAMRPYELRWKTRWVAIAILILLLLFTLFFLIFESVRIFLRAQIPNDGLDLFYFGAQGVFGAAPILILMGAFALLGEEILTIRRARSKAVPQTMLANPPIPFTRTQKYHLIGFWAAIVLAVEPLVTILFTMLPSNNDPVLFFLASLLSRFGGLIKVIAFLALILSLLQTVSPDKKTGLKIGLGLALLFGGMTLLQSVAPQLLIGIKSKLTQAINMDDHGFLLPSIIGCLMDLALLFTLPAYQKRGFQRAIRWLLVINALLAIPSVIFMDFGRHRQAIAMGANFLQDIIILPAASILLAVFFHRASRPSILDEDAVPPQISTP